MAQTMSRTCLVLLLLLGVLSCSLSEELHGFSTGDDMGRSDLGLSQRANKAGIGLDVFERFSGMISSTDDNIEMTFNRERKEKGFDPLLRAKSSWTKKGGRSKRWLFNRFGLFDNLRRLFQCKRLSNWRPATTLGTRDKQWMQVLNTDGTGSVLSGSKADLVEAVTNGSRIKINFLNYFGEVQNCRVIQQDVCCQGFHFLQQVSLQSFEFDSVIWQIVFCTTGDLDLVVQFVEGNNVGDSQFNIEFTWFAYKNNNGSYPEPLLSTDASGNVNSGSQTAVETAVRTGKSLTVVREDSVLVPIENVQLRDGTVSAQHVWRMGEDIVNDHFELVKDIYWEFLLLTPSGSQDIARWLYGTHTLINQTKDVVALDWFAGDDWVEAFTTCSPLTYGSPSRALLKSQVEAGVPIKVRFGHTYVEVDNVMISGDQVSAQVISMVAREDASTLEPDINWEFSTVATTRIVRTYRPLVGSANISIEGNTVTTQDITWYIDTRQWDLLFHISNDGTVLNGSALAVQNAVVRGSDIRVGYKRNGDPGFRFQTADHIFLAGSGTGVQLTRLIRDKNTTGDDFELDDQPVWSYTTLTTFGFMEKTEWIVGEHVNDGRIRERVEIKFFSSP